MVDILFNSWVPSRLIEQLDEAVIGSNRSSRDLAMLAAGLHDLGKATPIFQGQLVSQAAQEFTRQADILREAGMWFPTGAVLSPPTGKDKTILSRHEVASGLLIEDAFAADPHSFSSIAAGHHGKWRLFGEEEADEERLPLSCAYYGKLLLDPGWRAQAEAHRVEVEGVLGVSRPTSAEDFDRASVPLLTSVVCLADWLVSTESSLEKARQHTALLETSPSEFYARRREYLERLCRRTLGTPRIPAGSFSTIFGFEPTRPVQKAMVKTTAPGLSVVMVPMGEGKTEAALGQWMESAEPSQGLYFALPTMATADAMFDRVREFFTHTEDPVLGTLAHGRAVLNSFYQAGEAHTISTGDKVGGLSPQAWFSGRHRALLSPITVGTIDQLLAGVLRHKYNFLRFLGAATKTVVLDEVHTYDPYMSELLVAFLTWAGRFNLDVILLSATLPERRLRKYVSAYAEGAGHDGSLPAPPTYPSIVRFSGGRVISQDLSKESSGRETTVQLEWLASESDHVDAVVGRASSVLSQGEGVKLGIIMNTVAGAQKVAAQLAAQGHSPELLHARMTANERAARTERAILDFGKTSTDGTNVLVATQVVEASIDLDFDVLITQICPAPSLLQRSGRVWRHNRPEGHGSRTRPAFLAAPLVIVAHQNPLPDAPFTFLPYAAAEIHKTFSAFKMGETTSIRIPDDMQDLVDAADVTLADITDMGDMASDAILTETVRVMRSKDSRIPLPGKLSSDLKSLEDFTNGELDSEEFATRWSDSISVTILPISTTNQMAWCGPISSKPDAKTTLDILGHTIPASGAVARTVLGMANKHDPACVSGMFSTPLLSDVLVVDLDAVDGIALDPLLGLVG